MSNPNEGNFDPNVDINEEPDEDQGDIGQAEAGPNPYVPQSSASSPRAQLPPNQMEGMWPIPRQPQPLRRGIWPPPQRLRQGIWPPSRPQRLRQGLWPPPQRLRQGIWPPPSSQPLRQGIWPPSSSSSLRQPRPQTQRLRMPSFPGTQSPPPPPPPDAPNED